MTTAVPPSRDRRGGGSIALLLSLMLILLAFFILLNSMADFEASKADAVIESVNRTFNGKIEPLGRSPVYGGSLGALPEVEAKFTEVGSLFEAIVPDSRSKWIRRARAVHVELPAASLFRSASARLRPSRDTLIQRLVEALAHDPKGSPSYDLEILLGVGASGGGAAEGVSLDPRSIEVRRAAILAERLIEKGLPSRSLSIGLLPQHPGIVRFVVRLRRQDSARAAYGEAGVE